MGQTRENVESKGLVIFSFGLHNIRKYPFLGGCKELEKPVI